MKRILLTQGQYAIVDDKDYKRLNKHKWYAQWDIYTKSFYAIRKYKSKDDKWLHISMSRHILGLKYGDKRQCDHINHNTLDNCWLNLRMVTNQQNHFNQKNPKGYHWDKQHKKYRAQIGLNGKTISLGYFCTITEAHNAYLQAKKIYHIITIKKYKGGLAEKLGGKPISNKERVA